MWNKIKAAFEYGASHGWNFPAAFDANVAGPSVSLFLTHITSYIAILCIIFLAFKDLLMGTIISVLYAALMITFYLLRKLTHAKFDLDDKSIDLSNDNKEK